MADTDFLPKRGIFTAPIDVAITSATPGATIRYTTNGSTPTLTNGATYASPIHLEKTTVILAAPSATASSHQRRHQHLSLSGRRDPPGHRALWNQAEARMAEFRERRWPGDELRNGPAIVNHTNAAIGGQAQVKAALLALPTVCIRRTSRTSFTPPPAFTPIRATTAQPGNALPRSK